MLNIKEFFENLSSKQRITFAASVFGVVFLMVLLFAALGKQEYAVLFSDLREEDASSIVQQLEKQKIEYKLKANGTSILVAESEVHKIRLGLVAEGVVLKGGIGFELFDNADYGMTEFVQKINYQRALQGELARTITALDEVQYARLHIAIPNTKLFKKDSDATKASVTLVMKPHKSLSKEQVKGIQALVSAAVDDLEVARVTVLDQQGRILSKHTSEDDEGSNNRLQKKLRLELSLKSKVSKLLNNIAGLENAVTNVNVTLNYDKVRKTKEEVIVPRAEYNRGVIKSSKESRVMQEKSAASNENDKNVTVVNETTEREYGFGKSVEETIVSKGGIESISVSVLVPSTLSQADIESLETLVKASVGFDAGRGDVVEVKPMNMVGQVTVEDPPEMKDDAMAINEMESWVWANRYSVLAITLLVFIILILTLMRGKQSRLSKEDRQTLLNEIQTWAKEG